MGGIGCVCGGPRLSRDIAVGTVIADIHRRLATVGGSYIGAVAGARMNHSDLAAVTVMSQPRVRPAVHQKERDQKGDVKSASAQLARQRSEDVAIRPPYYQ